MLRRLPFVCPLKIYFKDGLQDNCRFGKLLMKPVEDVEFYRIKWMREGNSYKSDNFKMWILGEGAIYKVLKPTEKTFDGAKPGR